MQDISGSTVQVTEHENSVHPGAPTHRAEVVSTHVLVPESQAERLRELSRKTRIAQSEYLREAVEDLLGKYQKDEGGLP
jgi:hypothetical protein